MPLNKLFTEILQAHGLPQGTQREHILEAYMRKIQDQYEAYCDGANPRDCLAEIAELAASAMTGSGETRRV